MLQIMVNVPGMSLGGMFSYLGRYKPKGDNTKGVSIKGEKARIFLLGKQDTKRSGYWLNTSFIA